AGDDEEARPPGQFPRRRGQAVPDRPDHEALRGRRRRPLPRLSEGRRVQRDGHRPRAVSPRSSPPSQAHGAHAVATGVSPYTGKMSSRNRFFHPAAEGIPLSPIALPPGRNRFDGDGHWSMLDGPGRREGGWAPGTTLAGSRVHGPLLRGDSHQAGRHWSRFDGGDDLTMAESIALSRQLDGEPL